MIVDISTYNGERDLWDLHYNQLKREVDRFIVVEFDRTFSGKPKPPTFPVEQYLDVEYRFHTETLYEKYRELAESSPNTVGADHWKREFMQKESLKDALEGLSRDDTVFVGDVDEIWNIEALHTLKGTHKLKLKVYTYWLNNRSSEEFWGTLRTTYLDVENSCLNHLRTHAPKTQNSHGWHFTSMGGAAALTQKLTDSYTQESYATPSVLENVAYNIENARDFLGRDFTYTLDESEWPQFLRGNRERYTHLIASGTP